MFPVSKRQKEIINYLLRKNAPATGKEIALALSVSDRTIRLDIKALNARDEIIHATKQGYFVPGSEMIEARALIGQKNLQLEPFERMQFILKKLLLAQKTLDGYELAQELCISESTLEKDLKAMEEFMRDGLYRLRLQKHGFELELTGEEKERRALFSRLLAEEMKDNAFSLQQYQTFFRYDLTCLRSIVAEIIKEHTFYIRDTEQINFLVHLAIAMERVEQHEILQNTFHVEEKSAEYLLAEEIGAAVSRHFAVSFPETELKYVAFLLMGKKVIGGSFSSRLQLYRDMPVEYVEATEEILKAIWGEFGLNFLEDEQLIIGLTLHLQLLHERIRLGNQVRNFAAPDLKSNYPMIFEIAVFACKQFYEKLGLKAALSPESEISFIALHFGASYEARLKKNSKLKVALVCPSGYTTSHLLLEKLKRTYGDSIDVIGAYSLSEFESLKKNNIDYVFSTVNLGSLSPTPFLVISSFLSNADFRNIYEVLNKEVKKKELKSEQYFDKRFFYRMESLDDAAAAIKYLSERLLEAGIVDEDYAKLVLEREAIASTAFDNLFALPHAIELTAKKTLFAIAILDKAMDWNGQKVRLIMLSAIRKGERKTLNQLMGRLAEVLNNPARVKELTASETYDDFMLKLGF